MRLLLLLACSIGAVWPAWAAGPVPVGFETREFVDASRSNWQNTGHRPLSTVIWYPAAASSPLTVPQVGDPAWRPYFVQRRFAVAAPLDQMLADPKFGARIDKRRVFAAGHSAGGATSIMLAGGQFSGDEIAKFCNSAAADASCEPRELIEKAIAELAQLRTRDPAVQASLARAARSYRDQRIRAVAAMAPAVGPAFTEATLHAIAVPVFIVTAKADAVTPPATNALRYARFIPGARLLTVPGNANHFTFGSECTQEGRRALEVCRDGEGTDRTQVHELVAQRVLKFFDQQ